MEFKIKVRLVRVFLGIVGVLLLVIIGVISWGCWKMNQNEAIIKNLKNKKADLKNEAKALDIEKENLENKTKQLSMQRDNVNLIMTFFVTRDYFQVNETCSNRECLVCKIGWIYYKESCYLFSSYLSSWDDGLEYCQNKSATLAVINTQKEYEFLIKNIPSGSYWLGVTNVDNIWTWIDGTYYSLGDLFGYTPGSSYGALIGSTKSWHMFSTDYGCKSLCEQNAVNVSF